MNVYEANRIIIPEGSVKRILDRNNTVLWEISQSAVPFYIEATPGSKFYIGGVIPSQYAEENMIQLSYQYSFDNINWTSDFTRIYRNNVQNPDRYTILTVPNGGNRIYFRATTNAWHGPDLIDWGFSFKSSNGSYCNVGGNTMSLLYGSNFIGKTQFPSNDGGELRSLFNINIRYAHNLILPATTVNEYGYDNMFSGVTSLISAPYIPATTIKKAGCGYMFLDCTSLTDVLDIPAITLYERALGGMFDGCTSLVKAPNIVATTMINNSGGGYGPMNAMFSGCTSLTTPPERLDGMAPDGFANMFKGCTALEKSPYLSSKTLVANCFESMFWGCNNLREVRCAATDISAEGCTVAWMKSVAASGTFYKAPSMTSWSRGISGIPEGWTVRNL